MRASQESLAPAGFLVKVPLSDGIYVGNEFPKFTHFSLFESSPTPYSPSFNITLLVLAFTSALLTNSSFANPDLTFDL
jgi:hypothetical protein